MSRTLLHIMFWLVTDLFVEQEKVTTNWDVSKCHSFTNKESLCQQDIVQNCQTLLYVFHGFLSGLQNNFKTGILILLQKTLSLNKTKECRPLKGQWINTTHLFIILHQAQGGKNPGSHCRQQFLISKVHILLDLCHFQWSLSSQLVIGH